ncbi:hypothetical protein LTR36_006174 [Oleoguttula mirabilis]|uniref:Uncharacterized protein n=1 Tax=Oleoguttula mirabilis TaxID=1507867 RepID=A0AAV9JCM8_9PEZI|nr:hypothetical protein LTR36_006174 [Oleoguttula mirabilis]
MESEQYCLDISLKQTHNQPMRRRTHCSSERAAAAAATGNDRWRLDELRDGNKFNPATPSGGRYICSTAVLAAQQDKGQTPDFGEGLDDQRVIDLALEVTGVRLRDDNERYTRDKELGCSSETMSGTAKSSRPGPIAKLERNFGDESDDHRLTDLEMEVT